MDVQNYLKYAYAEQFKIFYGRKPTEEQLKVYIDFFLRKSNDAQKVAEVCQIPLKANEKAWSRKVYSRYIENLFGFKPNDLQLDLYISYDLKVIPDIEIIFDVNKFRNEKKDDELQGLSNR